MSTSKRLLGPVVCSLLAFIAAAAAPTVRVQQAPDYAGLASSYRASHGLADLPNDESAVPPALDRGFATLDVGLFDVRYAWSSLSDAKRADDFKLIVLGLIDVQGKWLQWIDERDAGPKGPPPPPELVAVRTWVDGWKMAAIRKSVASSDASRSFLALAGANEATVAALKAFADGMRSGSLARLTIENSFTRLVLAPTRSEFKGFTAFVGSLSDEWKALLWSPILPMRNEFHVNETVCLAMESPPADGGDAGLTLSEHEKTGLLQHVTQYAADRLLKHDCAAAIDPGLQVGAAVNLVIDVYGENNSRVAGSGEGNKTPERFKFVPGGRSQGGKLPKISADTDWRLLKGKEWFVTSLKAAQQEGGKFALKEKPGAPGPTAHFILDNKTEPGEHELATAPFFGAAAASKEIPANYFADYQEFLRAYRASFMHWLATAAKPAMADAPPRPFARLMRSCVTEPTRPFEERVAAIYGAPLTGADPASKALEWQFLAWLAK